MMAVMMEYLWAETRAALTDYLKAVKMAVSLVEMDYSMVDS